LLNRIFGAPFLHVQVFSRDTPLSPLLFILVLDPLKRLLQMTTKHCILSPLGVQATRMFASFYDDDDAVFINPTTSDVAAVQRILQPDW
jgi:hypothetical protein